MKVAVWGAGEIGKGVAYRLATTIFTSELHWINRSLEKIQFRVIDLEHGLDFAPTCRSVTAHLQAKAAQVLKGVEILVLTLGAAVGPDKKRADLYPENRKTFSESVVPALQGFEGVVLVVTNPVDLMARWLQRESGLPAERVFGLGTVVETARLRASLGSYLSPIRPAREVWAYAVGTHDEHFVPIAMPGLGLGTSMSDAELTEVLGNARQEVIQGAQRVKADGRSTLHPIAEGVVKVAEAIALDRHSILTVSVLDPDSPERLYYSVPCTVGRTGVVHRHPRLLSDPKVQADLEVCREELRSCLRTAGEV